MNWNKLTTRPLNDEEKEQYPDCDFMWDGKTPDIWERILVYAYGEIEIETWEECGVGFENRDDGIIYWMPLPDAPKEVAGDSEV